MEEAIRHTLPKKERLCGRTAISVLLAKGRHGSVPGIRYCYHSGSDSGVNRIMVSVPKKLFKRAVKRNLLKRRMRECWRRQKDKFEGATGYDILFTYSTKEILSYDEIYEAIGKAIEKTGISARAKSPQKDDTAKQ